MFTRVYRTALIAVVAICLLATPTLSSPVDAKLPGIAGSHEHLGVGINYPNPRVSMPSNGSCAPTDHLKRLMKRRPHGG